MKARIYMDHHGDVVRHIPDGHRLNPYGGGIDDVVTYTCPKEGGFINEYPSWRQVCDKLYNTGDTLRANDSAHMLDVIRREHAKLMRETT